MKLKNSHSRLSAPIIIFTIALVYLFVQDIPFQDRGTRIDLDEGGSGSIIRQIFFIAVAAYFFLKGIVSRKISRHFFPWSIVALLLWWSITVTWATSPEISFRRLAFNAIIFIWIYSATAVVGPKRSLQTLKNVSFALVFASLISGLLIPNAIHQAGEMDSGLVGAWRGVFYHKNQAGQVAAIALILGVFSAFPGFSFKSIRLRKIFLPLLGTFGGFALLILSNSKTSIGMLLPALLIGYVCTHIAMSRSRLLGYAALILTGTAAASAAIAIFFPQISSILTTPESFTGRAGMWAILVTMIIDRPISGFGFGSVFQAGAESAISGYANWSYLTFAHGHNGYLDLIVATGFIGFALFLISMFLSPTRWTLRLQDNDSDLRGGMIGLITFIALHSLLETTFMNPQQPLCVVLVMIAASSYQMASTSRHQPVARLSRRQPVTRPSL
ncbi:O-antigen ligase family protein [Stenotrophomonas thermophila]|nr:putative ExoQ-like protein [Stenotrophomonas maltophilia]